MLESLQISDIIGHFLGRVFHGLHSNELSAIFHRRWGIEQYCVYSDTWAQWMLPICMYNVVFACMYPTSTRQDGITQDIRKSSQHWLPFRVRHQYIITPLSSLVIMTITARPSSSHASTAKIRDEKTSEEIKWKISIIYTEELYIYMIKY